MTIKIILHIEGTDIVFGPAYLIKYTSLRKRRCIIWQMDLLFKEEEISIAKMPNRITMY
jgi:hypothetical protein